MKIAVFIGSIMNSAGLSKADYSLQADLHTVLGVLIGLGALFLISLLWVQVFKRLENVETGDH
jgi:hypothetical protein